MTGSFRVRIRILSREVAPSYLRRKKTSENIQKFQNIAKFRKLRSHFFIKNFVRKVA